MERQQDAELQRERARDSWRRVSESHDAGAEFVRAVEEHRREYFEAMARGEADGTEIEFRMDDNSQSQSVA